MVFYSKKLKKLLKKWPGKQTFGEFRFLPLFFVLGAALEYSMIHWHVGEVNFYKVYKRRRIEEQVEERLRNKISSET